MKQKNILLEKLKIDIEQMTVKHVNEIAKMKDDMKQLKASHADEVVQLNATLLGESQQHRETVEKLERGWQQKNNDLQSQLQTQKKEFMHALERQKKEHISAMKAMEYERIKCSKVATDHSESDQICTENEIEKVQFTYIDQWQRIMKGIKDPMDELVENQSGNCMPPVISKKCQVGFVRFNQSMLPKQQNAIMMTPSPSPPNDLHGKERTCIACGGRARLVMSFAYCNPNCKQNYL